MTPCDLLLGPGQGCPELAAARVVYGCLDLHINDRRMCDAHTRHWAVACTTGLLHCDRCGAICPDLLADWRPLTGNWELDAGRILTYSYHGHVT